MESIYTTHNHIQFIKTLNTGDTYKREQQFSTCEQLHSTVSYSQNALNSYVVICVVQSGLTNGWHGMKVYTILLQPVTP